MFVWKGILVLPRTGPVAIEPGCQTQWVCSILTNWAINVAHMFYNIISQNRAPTEVDFCEACEGIWTTAGKVPAEVYVILPY